MTKHKLDITVHADSIQFGDGLTVTFQRTLRIPDDGKSYPLPPGLGCFPLRRVDDYRDRVPETWARRGGVLLPMFQREAMWLSFQSPHWAPRAVQVGVGKVCAITGKPWSHELRSARQNYLVTPPQPWLDGINVGRKSIRQFVAMPLGAGYTVEGQVTGKETFGGLQLQVFEAREGRFQAPGPCASDATLFGADDAEMCLSACAPMAPAGAVASAAGSTFGAARAAAPRGLRKRAGAAALGLGAGGRMKQKIYPDPYGIQTWDPRRRGRLFVHLVNSQQWREITGEAPPESPVTAKEYAAHGMPWFDLYDDEARGLAATPELAGVKSIKEMDKKTFGGAALQDDESVVAQPVKGMVAPPAPLPANGVRDGDW